MSMAQSAPATGEQDPDDQTDAQPSPDEYGDNTVTERSRYMLAIKVGNGHRLRLRRCPLCELPLKPADSPTAHFEDHDWEDLPNVSSREPWQDDKADGPAVQQTLGDVQPTAAD